MKMRNYRELKKIDTFVDRFEYLKLSGKVAEETFGYERYLNQKFYRSDEWKRLRDIVILRDQGCDLGIRGRDIHGRIYIHHMNPISVDDIIHSTEYLLNPDYMICCSHQTHNAIHYGDASLLIQDPIERKPNDTCPWK